jgi:NAD(P)-dependent dehydrogenase (short-subunit alcohol dehydrogenase family)
MAFDLGAGLKGKAVLLTGAAGGIGREIALAFAAAGARVAAIDVAQGSADAVVAEMDGCPHIAIGHDLRPVAGH